MKEISHDLLDDISERYSGSKRKFLKNILNYEENLNYEIEEIISSIYDYHLYDNKFADINSYEKNV